MTAQTHTRPNRSADNVTPETPVLGGALALLAGLAVLAPDVALVVLGVPAAALLGVTVLAAAARLLAR